MSRHRKDTAPPPRLWVGWREWVGLPELGLHPIKAKIDTGAATSALHAIHLHTFVDNGMPHVSFEVHPEQRSTRTTVRCTAPIVDERWVSSSTGHREHRFVIRTPVRLGQVEYPIELTLTNRDSMGFRMLLGRRAMRGQLVVDPSASYLCEGPPIAVAARPRYRFY